MVGTTLEVVINSVSSAAAAAAVFVAIYYARLERRAREDADLRYFFAWTEMKEDGWWLVMSNETPRPIYTWSVELAWDADGIRNEDSVSSDAIGLIPPGAHLTKWSPPSNPANDAAVHVWLRFSDSRARCWLRTPDGRLQKARCPT